MIQNRTNVRKNNRALGNTYEEKTAQYLQKLGFEIVERNYRCRMGEIDIIAKELGVLCFIEVKYRSNARAGFSLDAIDARKQNRIRNAARFYLYSHGLSEETACRFDAAGIDEDRMTYVRNAF